MAFFGIHAALLVFSLVVVTSLAQAPGPSPMQAPPTVSPQPSAPAPLVSPPTAAPPSPPTAPVPSPVTVSPPPPPTAAPVSETPLSPGSIESPTTPSVGAAAGFSASWITAAVCAIVYAL